MNFLAHFALSHQTDEMIVGAFLGDFCKGRIEQQPERYRDGIWLHRKVDAFTDEHPLVDLSKDRLRGECGYYSPVILDVLHDHLLAANWKRFHAEPLDDFCQRVYAALLRHTAGMPERAAWVATRMAETDWLSSYRQLDGTREALRRMSTRLRKPFPLERGVDLLEADYGAFEEEFVDFFSRLQSYVQSLSIPDWTAA